MLIPGVIVRLIVSNGYGFVRRHDGDVEFFFHRSAVKGARFEDLFAGRSVMFEEGDSVKGPRANKVTVA